jgi:hypothetical protein
LQQTYNSIEGARIDANGLRSQQRGQFEKRIPSAAKAGWRFALIAAVNRCATQKQELLSDHRLQTTAVKFKQLSGVVFGLGGGCCSLETDSGAGGFAVTGGHCDEFHEVEGNVFVAAGAHGESGQFHDETPDEW